MAKFIQIRKFKQQNEKHFYKIFTEDFESKPLYMMINDKNHLISFYKTDHDEKPILEIDLTKSQDLSNFDIDRGLLFPAIWQASKAIKKNQFPDSLDYCV